MDSFANEKILREIWRDLKDSENPEEQLAARAAADILAGDGVYYALRYMRQDIDTWQFNYDRHLHNPNKTVLHMRALNTLSDRLEVARDLMQRVSDAGYGLAY